MTEGLRVERLIAAPPEVVFDTFTTRGGQEAFYGQDDPGWVVDSSCDLRLGGSWTVLFGPAPDRLTRHRHVFEVIERPHRLLLATSELRVDGSSLDVSTEFTFAEKHGWTLMTMTQTGLPTGELREEHVRGVPHALARLAEQVRAPRRT